jgi:phosphatidylglycerol---prolipoprotein diacylglyceryl transferase
MYPELFRIPGLNLPIFSYGLMMVIGFLAAVQLAKFLAKRVGLDPEIFVNAALIALLAGIIGARLSHVLENLPAYTRADRSAWENFRDMINIRSGGLTFYGGLILAFPIVVLYGVWKKVPIRRGMDIVAPCIMLGLAFGRIGCFLNGCCYGAEANMPWAVCFPYQSSAYVDEVAKGEINPPRALMIDDWGTSRPATPEEIRQGYALVMQAGPDGRPARARDGKPVLERVTIDPSARELAIAEKSRSLHPAQLYSSFNSFLITAILVAFFTLRPAPGRVMALMLMLEGATRYLLELVRAEPAIIGTWSLSMVLGIVLVLGGIVMWVTLGHRVQGSGFPPLPRAGRVQEA